MSQGPAGRSSDSMYVWVARRHQGDRRVQLEGRRRRDRDRPVEGTVRRAAMRSLVERAAAT
eukprot:2637275-Pleurochrysis_carterae.AAC.1